MRTLRSLALVLALLAAAPLLRAAAPRPVASAPLAAVVSASSASGTAREASDRDTSADARRAKAALARLSANYRYLEDVTVTIGDTPNGEEAVAYYSEGRIVIDRAHSVGVDAILAHEVWHVIDWRDNGRMDWGEKLPPANSADYATGATIR